MTKTLGLVGYPGAGKDTLADLLVETGRWKKVAFADVMKDLFLLCRPWAKDPGSLYYDPIRDRQELEKVKRFDPGARKALQSFGQAIRDIYPDFWVQAAMETALKHREEGFNVVLSDVRYSNEVRCCGRLVGIRRLGCGPVNDHPSETNTASLLMAADVTIQNDGDPMDMLLALEDSLGSLR